MTFLQSESVSASLAVTVMMMLTPWVVVGEWRESPSGSTLEKRCKVTSNRSVA